MLSTRMLRFAANPISRRSLATVAAPLTRTTTLPNGLTVATESSPSKTATVGIWIDAGSRGDSPKASGTAHFLEHMAFKGTSKRSQSSLELEVENLGAHLNAYTSREQTVYYAKSFSQDVDKAVGILGDILLDSKLEEGAIERERGVILRESEEVDKMTEEVVFDHLHSVAFQGQPLGRTILGPIESINTISRKDLSEYISTNYKADKMVLVGAGGVDHDSLVKLANAHFGNLPTSESPLGFGVAPVSSTPVFTGSDVRVRDDTMDAAHFAIAFEGVGWNSPDYYTMLVMSSIIGNWDRSLGGANLLSSRLSTIYSENNLANSFMSFSTSYKETGLWGIYIVSENVTNLDDVTYFLFKEWNRLSTSPLENEIARAKSQLKASLLLSLDSSTAIAEDIGRSIVTTGRRATPAEIEAAIDAVDANAIQTAAKKYLWDKDIAVAAVGQIEGLFDYSRLRNATHSLLW